MSWEERNKEKVGWRQDKERVNKTNWRLDVVVQVFRQVLEILLQRILTVAYTSNHKGVQIFWKVVI